MYSKSCQSALMLLAIACAVVAVVPMPAAAQYEEIPFYTGMQNDYIGFSIGQGGNWVPDPPLDPEDDHWLISATPPAGGRLHMWTTGGDPTTADDDNLHLIFTYFTDMLGPGDKWGAWQIMVDTWEQGDEGEILHVWAPFEVGGTSGVFGIGGEDGGSDGFWTVVPYIPSNENVVKAVWYPTPTEAMDPMGEEYANPDISDKPWIPIRCELEAKLMRDTVRFKWTITNEDRWDHLVGLRFYADFLTAALGYRWKDYWTPMSIVSVPGRQIITDRTVLSGKDITPAVEMLNSQSDPTISIRTIHQGQGATPPDKVGIDDWWSVADPSWTYGIGNDVDWFSSWLYEPVPYDYIWDLAYGAFWKPRRLQTGQSMTIIQYIGLGCATSDFTKPNIDHAQYVAAVQGPRALKYYTPDEPTADDPLMEKRLYPEPFTISAYLYNTEKFVDLYNPTFTLILPAGLTLDTSDPGNQYTKTLSKISAEEEGSVSWSVRPVGRPTGILDYSVSFTANPVGSTTVTRQINVAATEWQPLSKGWQMISVPFSLTNTDPATALGLSGEYIFWKYNTYLRKYEPVYDLKSGESYWLWLKDAQTADLTEISGGLPGGTANYAPIQWAGTQGYQIPLQTGWNLIGNPYIYAVTMGEVRFYHRDYGSLTYDDAVARGMISKTIYWWNPIFKRYNWASDRTVQIKPWQGYWVKALRPDVILVITPITQIGAGLGGVPSEGTEPPAIP